MKAYLVPTAPVGYGPRIFIPYDLHTLEVEYLLRPLSMWGGYDKDTGKCYGYEFPSEDLTGFYTTPETAARFGQAKDKLQELGFVLENQSAENQAEVWD